MIYTVSNKTQDALLFIAVALLGVCVGYFIAMVEVKLKHKPVAPLSSQYQCFGNLDKIVCKKVDELKTPTKLIL